MDHAKRFYFLSIALGVIGATHLVAATHPTTTIIPDNVVTCQVNSGCTQSDDVRPHLQSLIRTDRLVVMVSPLRRRRLHPFPAPT